MKLEGSPFEEACLRAALLMKQVYACIDSYHETCGTCSTHDRSQHILRHICACDHFPQHLKIRFGLMMHRHTLPLVSHGFLRAISYAPDAWQRGKTLTVPDTLTPYAINILIGIAMLYKAGLRIIDQHGSDVTAAHLSLTQQEALRF